jgi:DnaK suppressor protein
MAEAAYQKIRANLTEELASVDRQLEEHGFDKERGSVEVEVNDGFADSAAATTERAETIALAEQLRSHRDNLVGAIERIDSGTYGKCERCGNAISIERLEAIPAASLCVSCKQLAG